MDASIEKRIVPSGYRFSLIAEGEELGRAWLYILHNDLHKEPFGFIEDVYVDARCRGKGYGTELVEALIDEAKREGCYKIVLTSRNTKPEVHRFYAKFGFEEWGKEFRLPLA